MARTVAADPLDHLQMDLPRQIGGWAVEGQDRLYDEKTIFEYIDGGAEVYKAYGMRRCLARRFAKPDMPAVMLDIFDMEKSQEAYGVFTHDTEGEPVAIGGDARYRPGWLSFWKGPFFVSIYMEAEIPETRQILTTMGQQVASAIQAQGERPSILSRLPQQGLLGEQTRYLHHPVILNYHYYLSDENILNISAQTDAVLGSYRQNNQSAKLLMVHYPDAAAARSALQNFLKLYLSDAPENQLVRLENGKWAGALTSDRILAVLLEADGRGLAEALLTPFLKEQPVRSGGRSDGKK